MLLTVIAVATLLVAVVGATFAYFSLSVSGSAQTTTANVSTGKVGTVTYSSENTALYLGVSASDMDKSVGDKTYYAGTVAPTLNEFKHTDSPAAITLSKVALSGADVGDTYTCDATLDITVAGLEASNLKTGWMELTLGGALLDGVSDLEEPIDLYDWLTENETKTKSYQINDFKLTGEEEKEVTAVLSISNKQTEEQNILAEKSATVTIKLAPVNDSCTVTKAA